MPDAPTATAAPTNVPAPAEAAPPAVATEASASGGSSGSAPAQPAPPEAGGRYKPDPRFAAQNGFSRRAADKSGYTTPAGRLPGATTILGATSAGKERLAQWLKRPDSAAVSHAARERGTWTHTQIESWLQGHPTEKHFAYGGYWRNVRPWLETHLISALAIEGATWHPAGYAGTFDAVAHLAYAAPDSPYSAHQAAEMVTLVDWKTSARPRTADLLLDYFDQLGAYSASILHTYGVQVDRGVLVIARPSGSTPDVYELTPDALAQHRARFFQRLNDYHAPPPPPPHRPRLGPHRQTWAPVTFCYAFKYAPQVGSLGPRQWPQAPTTPAWPFKRRCMGGSSVSTAPQAPPPRPRWIHTVTSTPPTNPTKPVAPMAPM